MMRRISSIIIFIMIPCVLLAGDFSSSAKGTTTAGFLKLGVGARAIALGEAFTAVSDSAESMYWNPAGMIRVDNQAVTLMHSAYIDSSYFDYASFVKNIGSSGAVGLAIQYLSVGEITETNTSGVDVGTFNPNDIAVSLGYAYEFKSSLLEGYAVGLIGKFIKSTIINSADAIAGDIGFLSPLYLNNKLRLGFSASNIGSKMKFEVEEEDLPLLLKAGSMYNLTNNWLLALDVGFPKDNENYFAFGSEYRARLWNEWNFSGRAGINTRTLDDIEGFSGISFGFGVLVKKLSLDYAFLPFGDLGSTHRISLTQLW